jgi:hypothetical protein
MSNPRYFIAYSYFTPEAGMNPLGHSSLLFCKMSSEEAPIEVVNSFGFYSQPNTTDWLTPISYLFKKTFNVEVDLQHTHGILQQEELQYIDRGVGAFGNCFDVRQDKFEEILLACELEIKTQYQVMAELDKLLAIEKKALSGANRYQKELQLAQQEGRQPRLYPFHFELSFNGWELSTEKSHTCKNRALDILAHHNVAIEQLSQLRSTPFGQSLPRAGHAMDSERLSLFSMGAYMRDPEAPAHQPNFFKAWRISEDKIQSKPAQLFFSLPPQSFLESIDPQILPTEKRQSLEDLIARLQISERLIVNSCQPERFSEEKRVLIKKLQRLYPQFGTIAILRDKPLCLQLEKEAQAVLDRCQKVIMADRLSSQFALQVYSSIAWAGMIAGCAILITSVMATAFAGAGLWGLIGAGAALAALGWLSITQFEKTLDYLAEISDPKETFQPDQQLSA